MAKDHEVDRLLNEGPKYEIEEWRTFEELFGSDVLLHLDLHEVDADGNRNGNRLGVVLNLGDENNVFGVFFEILKAVNPKRIGLERSGE